MIVYLDLNIFDRIEKKANLTGTELELYSDLEEMIHKEEITVPYSNAHLNDLFRGFQKNPSYVDGHLKNIKRLTRDLCICQYWGRNETTWHFRDINEFFTEKKTEWEFDTESFEDIFESDYGLSKLFDLVRSIPLPNNWKLGYQQDPMFGVMYPTSKIGNNMGALMEDIFNFQNRLKSDYSFYKSFKLYLNKSLIKYRKNPKMMNALKSNFKDLPKHLDIFEIADLYAPKNKTSENENYSKVIRTFYKFDLKGYKTDANFNNMFDDSLHTFYGAHCDFFITNDVRCQYKALKTYERLNITTKVIKANEIDQLKNCLQ